MTLVPPSRPRITRDVAAFILSSHKVTAAVAIIGVRGYYRDSMGKPGVNDRGIYDDALMVVGPETFATFNGNVDPSADPSQSRPHLACLQPGVWQYKPGIHGLNRPKAQQYRALVQAGPVTVRRDFDGFETGFFGINIHRGGVNGTSSLGCQTLPPDQWQAFFSLVELELARAGQKTVPYVLTVQD